MIRRIIPPLIVLLAVMVVSCSPGAAPTSGAKAPDFELFDTAGNAVRLSDFLGRPVAVNFWGISCAYCVEELPDLEEAFLEESAKADGVAILTINVQDDAANTRKFFSDNGYTMPALVDSGGRVAVAYGVSAIPITFFIDREGVVRYVKRGMFLSIREVHVALDRVR